MTVIALVLVLSAAGAAKAPPYLKVDSLRAVAEAQAKKGGFERVDPRAFELFVNGLLMEYSGDMLAASQLYQQALDFFPQSYEIRFSWAAALYGLRRPTEALEVLRQLSKIDGPAYGLVAACYRAVGDVDNATQAYLRQVQFDSSATSAYFFLSGYYRSKNNLDSAVWACRNLSRLLPENFQVLNDLGRLEALRGNIDSAEAVFGRSVDLQSDTSNAQAVVGLSESYEMKEQPDSATAVLEKAVKVSPAYIPYRQSLINLYARMDSVGRALPHARMVAEANPGDGFSARRLGILYYELDSLDKADSIFSSRVKAREESPLNYYYLGRISMVRRDWKKARDQFEHMTKLADTSAGAWISLAGAYRQLGENDRAVEILRSATDRMPNEKAAFDVYYALGSTYEQAGMVDSAVSVFEELLKHAPNFAQALNYLGYTLADRNMRLEYAKGLIAKALELEPGNTAYLDSYGWVLFRLGNFEEGLKYLLQAAELQSDPTVLEHVGDTYKAMNDPLKAKEWWQKALKLQPENKQLKEKLKQ